MTKIASHNQAIHHRNYQRARARALSRLARVYKDQYKLFLQEEREKDEELGKKWISFDTNSSAVISIESYKDVREGAVDPDYEGTNPSYYGGEE